jgi:hypothetical protein
MRDPILFHVQIVFDIDMKNQPKKNAALPPILYLRKGDTVRFYSKNTDSVIFVPNANVLFGDKDENLLIPVGQDRMTKPFTINAITGTFPYCVYCGAGNDFAEGYSAPKMIIED